MPRLLLWLALLALVLSLALAFTTLPRVLQLLLVSGAFAGALLDTGSWFLTKSFGAPWHAV